MAAGFETTSHAITWTLAALAAHPDIQQQLVDELASLGLAAAAAGEDGLSFLGNHSLHSWLLALRPPATQLLGL
jgi:cytochrome P450